MTVLLLGVRHHGPGSAQAVRRALEHVRPDAVLIEGPPEADNLVRFAGDPDLRPPVALLAYPLAGDQSARASFWPFAEFSPEWQALTWAVRFGVPVRFFDLPVVHRFAARPARKDDEPEPDAADQTRQDPIGALAMAAGYDDAERWWEDVVEHRLDHADPLAPFEAIASAMAAVREAAPSPPGAEAVEEERREAHMRQVLRATRKQHATVAVICGAWHVPALTDPLPTAVADAKVLRGLPKVKVGMTWVPWTHGRLASWSGYGAGVRSPGWYHHLFTTKDRAVARWLVKVAGVLREEGLPVSSGHLIEATRLAETLAALRGRPLAGLAEVTEATRSVLCDGDELRVALVDRRLVVGERLGEVPAGTPGAPLLADLTAAQRRLRMQPEATIKDVDLDLRRDIDGERSRLLHRLIALDVAWGKPQPARRGKGTFWESWRLEWQPEFAVDLIAASGYGTTVLGAATARSVERATKAETLGKVTAVVERCLLADLPAALPPVLATLSERMALDTDVTHLMEALPALARTLRYGDVRGTDVGSLGSVTATMLTRIRIGLPSAVTSLDDDAARAMRDRLDDVHAAVSLIGAADEWIESLARLADRDDLPGLLAGRIVRLLLDAGRLQPADVERRLALALTVGTPVARGAAWIEGFLSGGGLLLVHDERLLRLVDEWLSGIPADGFTEALPLLRRTFSEFAEPERRAIGNRVRNLDAAAETSGGTGDLDAERAALVLPTIAALLGRKVLPDD